MSTCVANQVGVYLTTVLSVLALWFVVVLDERLRDRFGDEYENSCRAFADAARIRDQATP